MLRVLKQDSEIDLINALMQSIEFHLSLLAIGLRTGFLPLTTGTHHAAIVNQLLQFQNQLVLVLLHPLDVHAGHFKRQFGDIRLPRGTGRQVELGQERAFDIFERELFGALQQIELTDYGVIGSGGVVTLFQSDLCRSGSRKQQQEQKSEYVFFLFHGFSSLENGLFHTSI